MQEAETANLRLSDLYMWQKALGVPVGELLSSPDSALSSPIRERAQLLRLMKSAASILQGGKTPAVRRMAQNMVNQLIEMMPELKCVDSWHSVGKRRGLDEYGRIAERPLSEDALFRHNSRNLPE